MYFDRAGEPKFRLSLRRSLHKAPPCPAMLGSLICEADKTDLGIFLEDIPAVSLVKGFTVWSTKAYFASTNSCESLRDGESRKHTSGRSDTWTNTAMLRSWKLRPASRRTFTDFAIEPGVSTRCRNHAVRLQASQSLCQGHPWSKRKQRGPNASAKKSHKCACSSSTYGCCLS